MKLRLWAKVEYDGTDFFGFQIQAYERTVQGEIERALEAVTGKKTRIIGAGRTDRGVHAQGQIISFEVTWRHSLSVLERAMNATLASDVVLVEMGLAPEGFHPRFSASSRTYRYKLLFRPWRSPLARRYVWHITPAPDEDRMARAGRSLVGTHDFATFGRPPQGENTVRTVYRAEFRQEGHLTVFDIEADAFLNRMVRSIVGTLVLVGWGWMSPEEFEMLMQARDRSLVKQVAPAYGLTLMQVNYARFEGVRQ